MNDTTRTRSAWSRIITPTLLAGMLLLLAASCSQPRNPSTATPEAASGQGPFEKFREQGVDFYATGNEPFWALEVDHGSRLTFHTMDGFRAEFQGASPPVPLPDEKGYSYTAPTNNGSISVTVLRERCIDSMSGDTIPYRVTIQLNRTDQKSETFQGCGRFLNAPELRGTWLLTGMNGMPPDTAGLMHGPPTLEMEWEQHRIWGNNSCNNYNGQADVMGDRIAISTRLASTLKACPRMDMESNFMNALSGKTYALRLEQGELQLLEGDKVVLQFRKKTP